MSRYLDLDFAPALLLFVLIPIAMVVRFLFGRMRVMVVPYARFWRSTLGRAQNLRLAAWWYVALIFVILAAAEPVMVSPSQISRPAGADVVIALDVSTSMLAEDLASEAKPEDRLSVLKPALMEFIDHDSIGRVGVVLFAGRAYTLVPLSADRSWLKRQIESLEIGDIEDGTAIGDGLGLSLTQFTLAEPADRSRTVVLLTDGSNTSGVLTPPQAAAIAKRFSIPIYSIAMGRDGYAPYPVFDEQGRRIGSREQPSSVDRETLIAIARETGGAHHDAAGAQQLAGALAAISARLTVVQKSETKIDRRSLAPSLLLAALIAMMILLLMLYRAMGWRSVSRAKVLEGIIAGGQLQIRTVGSWLRSLPLFLLIAALSVAVVLWLYQNKPAPLIATPQQVLFALDASRSMDIVDESGASRIERAKRLAARTLSQLHPNTAAGVLVFAGSAHLVAPITTERNLAERALKSFGSNHLPKQGSSFLELIRTATTSFDAGTGDKVLVLLSDGEANPEGWASEVSRLKAMGVRVIAVGFGQERTAPIPVSSGGWLRDARGLFVYAQPQPENLRRLATATGGLILSAHENPTLTRQLLDSLSPIKPSDRRSWLAEITEDAPHRVLLSLVLILLLISAWREVPARARLSTFDVSTRRATTASGLVAAVVIVGMSSLSIRSEAQLKRPLQTIQSAEERDALNEVNAVVRDMLSRPGLRAEDYRRLAQAAADYGAIHRLHAHPISEGVLRDGLAAVLLGRQLDPSVAAWNGLEQQLRRLLEPPPPVMADDGEIDPANEPLEGKLAMGSSGEPEPLPTERSEGTETSDVDDVRSAGGGAADEFGASEWRDASVAVPLYLLREVERGDSYAELFRNMQGRSSGREIRLTPPTQGW